MLAHATEVARWRLGKASPPFTPSSSPKEEERQEGTRDNGSDDDGGLAAIFKWEQNGAEHQCRDQEVGP